MQLPGFRALDRGEFSILAAFTLVVLLAGTGLFLQTFSPVPTSQTAAAQTPLPPAKPASLTAAQQAQAQECQVQIQAAIKNNGKSPDLKQQFTKNTTENDKCVGAILKNGATDKQNASSYQCVGQLTKVSMDQTGKGTITSTPDTTGEVEQGTCLTKFCDANGENCTPAKLWSGGMDSMQKWALSSDVFPNMSTAQQSTIITNLGGINQGDQQALNAALGDARYGVTQNAQTLNGAVTSCPATGSTCNVNQEIAQIAQQNGVQCTPSGDAFSVSYNCDAKGLQQANTNLQQQVKDLAAAQVPLAPAQQCPSGQTGIPPSCTPITSAPPGNQNPTNQNSGNTFGSSGLNSLLSGLARGLAQTPVAPAAPVAAQACSTDPNAYAQQQAQYQQQQQQYNYQLQQYQYQQQQSYAYGGVALPAAPVPPQPCAPSTQQQCSLQPQQPAASSCTGGNWTPQMSGACIVGWQCSNLGAQISCQPQTADVGMSIAISYSCAQGTASGGGFTASGQSGTSTTTVQAPPAGSNTATYGLTCTSGAVSSGAQCSIQIASPSIILVANPATISSGATSLIGWVTTGMQACVISSASDATFTSQNSANTSANGTATTLPATSSEQYVLSCTTVSGATKTAAVTVAVQ